jgi:hypothetical protein
MTTAANAQLRLGILGGLNFADIKVTDGQGTSMITTFGFGGIMDININEYIGIALEPMYLQKGAAFEAGDNPNEHPPGELHSNFIEMPVLLKVSFGDRVRPYVLAGPCIGYRLSSDIEVEIEGLTLEGDMKDVTKDLDFGVTLGVGITVPVQNIFLFLESRYTLGLTNRTAGGTVDLGTGSVSIPVEFTEDEDDFKSRGFQVMLGAMIPIGQ